MKSHMILLLVAFAAAHFVITDAGGPPTVDDLNADKDGELQTNLGYLRELLQPYADHKTAVDAFVLEADTGNNLALYFDQMKALKDASSAYPAFKEETKLLMREIKKLIRDVQRERDEASEESTRIQEAINDNAVDYDALKGALTSQLLIDCFTDAGGANGYRMFESTCLKINSDNKNFDDARASCQALGMDLVTVDSLEMDDFIRDMFYAYGTRESNNYYVYWLGGRRPTTSDNFSWVVTGQALSSGYQGWDVGEPNNLANENCLHYWRNDRWNDIPCSNSYKYFCQLY